MTLRELVNHIAYPQLIQSMNPTSIALYGALHYFPMQPIAYYAVQLRRSKSSVYQGVSELLNADWIYKCHAKGPHNSTIYVPWMPPDIESTVATALTEVRSDIHHVGEWIMRCILDLIVPDTDVWDNARPPWLVTQDGSGRLEFDRWYRSARVAFEFQGPQHFQDGQQMMRDNVKAGICHRHHIAYIEVVGSDLTPQIIRDKAKGHLPLFTIKETGAVYSTLVKMCQSYINSIHRAERRAR